MMRAVILALIGLTVGITAGSITAVWRGMESPGPAESAVSDSTAMHDGDVDAVAADSAGMMEATAGPNTLALGGGAEADAVTAPTLRDTVVVARSEAGGSGSAGVTAAGRVAGGVEDEVAVEGAERLARIFGAMKPAEAARVLERLSDAEVRAILQHVGDRKVAAILGHFDAARAATLSRSVIQQGMAAP